MQLQETHAIFSSVFISRVISVLHDDRIGSNTDINSIELDSESLDRNTIYSEYLARWATWAALTWTDESEHGVDLRREVILQVAPIYIPGYDHGPKAKMYD